jgi:hypothetical protein
VIDRFRSFRDIGTHFRIFLTGLLFGVVIGCGGGENPTSTPPPPQSPVIQSFSANPHTITTGQSATLSWTTSGATSLSIDQGIGSVTGNSRIVKPATTTTYTLTAMNAPDSSVTATATVTVNNTAPIISSFTATPSTITAGGSSTLSWTTSGATSLSIDQGIGSVTGNSRIVTPGSTITYTLTAANASGNTTKTVTVTVSSASVVRIIYLHHSTGEIIWNGGVENQVNAYNTAHATQYRITEMNYPGGDHGYPWDNYPYDYWNLWVRFTGANRDREELNLDDLVARYDVIVFKHCFPVSAVEPPDGNPNIASDARTIANYQLQYEALKTRMRQFPTKKFLLWTGAALRKLDTSRNEALRAKQVFDWVKTTWNEAGDNIFVWDFRALETAGSEEGLYLNDAFAGGDSHPTDAFAQTVAPFFVKRLVDIIEGRGDSGSITGN